MQVLKLKIKSKKILLHTGNREFRKDVQRFEKKLHLSSRKRDDADLFKPDLNWEPLASARLKTFIQVQSSAKDLPEILAALRKMNQRKPGGHRKAKQGRMSVSLIHWKPNQRPMERRRYWAAYEKGLKQGSLH